MKKLLFYITLFATLSLVSCNDWLDVSPEAETTEDEMFTEVNGFKSALTACYIKLNSANLYGCRLIMTDIEYLAQHWSYNTDNFRDVEKLKDFQYDIEYAENTFSTIYGEMYNTIAQANTILLNMPEHGSVITNEDLKAVIEAEALSIRAFCHFDILRLFGQIPQNATQKVSLPYAKTVSKEQIPYYTFDEFVSLILADLDAAEKLFKDHDPLLKYNFTELDNYYNSDYDVTLEDEYLGFRRFRFNYYAVKALQARIYMYLGKKTEAYTTAMEVINAVDKEGKKMLDLAGIAEMNANHFALPSECILALSNSNLEDNIQTLTDLYNTTTGIYLTENQFEKDLFVGQSVAINNRVYLWNRTQDHQGSIKPRLKKYDQPESSSNTTLEALASLYQVVPLIRLSEMYLIAMESTASLNEANTLYSTYMTARNVAARTLTQEALTAEILREYRREFFGEGQMFYTYKRLGEKNMLWKVDRDVTENDYVVPLPSSELKAN